MKIFFFEGVSKNSLFWQLGPENAHPNNTIKIGVSASFCLKKNYASRNGHFWTKTPDSEISVIHCFVPFSSLSTPKKPKNMLKPHFSKPKKQNFQKINLNREWPRYCRKVYWTRMVQNGPNDHFGQNDLIPNRILAFARPKWTKMVHVGPFWPEEVHFGPFRSANRTLALPD